MLNYFQKLLLHFLIIAPIAVTAGCASYSGIVTPTAESPIISKPAEILPMRTIGIVSSQSRSGVPYGTVEESIYSAFVERFLSVPDLTFKRLALDQLDDQFQEDTNTAFWIELASKFQVDGILRIKNQNYQDPSLAEKAYAGSLLPHNAQNPYSMWRASLFTAKTGELVWDQSFYAGSSGIGVLASAMASNEQSFLTLAKEIARDWPVYPEQWALGKDLKLGSFFSPMHDSEKGIKYAGCYENKATMKVVWERFQIVFPSDGHDVGFYIGFTNYKKRKLRVDWVTPNGHVVRTNKYTISDWVAKDVFDVLKLKDIPTQDRKGVWNVKVWEGVELLDQYAFLVS